MGEAGLMQALDPAGKKENSKKLLKVISFAFLCAVVIFAGSFLYQNFGKVSPIIANSNPYLLVLALVLHFLFVIFQGTLGVAVLRATGGEVAYSKALPALCLSLMGRYVPGKVWVVTSRVFLLSSMGIRTTLVVASAVKEHIYTIFSGLLIALVFMPTVMTGDFFAYLWGMAVLAGFFLLPPRFVHATVNRGLAFMGKQPLDKWGTHSTALIFISLYFLNWMVLGLGLIFLAMSLFPWVPFSLVLPWTGLYALAVSAGFLAVFAPGGIGVREGIFFLGFTSVLDTVEAGALVLMTRLAITLAEILVLLAALTLGKLHNYPEVSSSTAACQDGSLSDENMRIEHD